MTDAVAVPETKIDRRVGPRLTPSQAALGYSEESLAHYRASQYIHRYLLRKAVASPNSAKTYGTHLTAFAYYIFKEKGGIEVDKFTDSLKTQADVAYDILADFAKYRSGKRGTEYRNKFIHTITSEMESEKIQVSLKWRNTLDFLNFLDRRD